MPDSIDNIKEPRQGMSAELVPKDNDFNNVFGNYSRHMYNNFFKIFQTDVNFFVMVPRSLLPYYYYVVLHQLFWYRGFVPGIHNNNIVGQQLGGWICSTIANLTASGGFHVETDDDELEDGLTNMLNRRKLVNKLSRRLPMLNAGGFMLAYATIEYDTPIDKLTNYNMRFVDCNRHYAKVDADGNVLGFVAHIKTSTPDPTSGEHGYYLIIRRWLQNIGGNMVCLERYSIYEGPAWITTPTFDNLDASSCAEVTKAPDDVMMSFQSYLGKIKLNTTMVTPFKYGCGSSIIHNSHTADGVEEYENFSSGTLFHIVNQLYEFELTKAQKMVNKYMAVTKVLLPDNFYSPPSPANSKGDPDRYQAQLAGYHASFHEQVGHSIFKRVPYVTAEEQSPFFFQAKNESEIYNQDIKFLLSEIASKIHISTSTLAPFISEKAGLNQKTAEEVNVEENETRLTISTKRELISTGLETVLHQIAEAAGYKADSIQVIFNNEEISNPIKEINLIGRKLELGLTSRERALKRANRHLSKRDLIKLQEEIRSDEQEKHERKLELKEQSSQSEELTNKAPQKGIPATK